MLIYRATRIAFGRQSSHSPLLRARAVRPAASRR